MSCCVAEIASETLLSFAMVIDKLCAVRNLLRRQGHGMWAPPLKVAYRVGSAIRVFIPALTWPANILSGEIARSGNDAGGCSDRSGSLAMLTAMRRAGRRPQ